MLSMDGDGRINGLEKTACADFREADTDMRHSVAVQVIAL